jgi:hypothetical protein
MISTKTSEFKYDKNTIVTIPHSLVSAQYHLKRRADLLRVMAMCRLSKYCYILGVSPIIEITAKDWQDMDVQSENPCKDLKIAIRDFSASEVKFKNDKASEGYEYSEYGRRNEMKMTNAHFHKLGIDY